ncbi:NLR family, CARD domain containing 5 [Acanthochromis polyacanthus]|uniref:NLR family, CARD domain containing 5 n=1 Tax=Acanthochromis polyacanthus TaxID=80966 RepID=UPI002233F526|nr:NLR family, CARD domain containing 5 [Acanthochromis polyacanthus]
MDEEVDPNEENVNSVLAQESSELFHILSRQSPTTIMELCQMMPSEARWENQLSAASSSTDPIKAMLDYFRVARPEKCRIFLQSVCFLCENIPMHLESRLISVAGDPSSVDDLSPEDHNPPSPPSEEQLMKRPRIDHWDEYFTSVRGLLQWRWKRLTERLVKDVQLENVWVSLRNTNRVRDRPDQTPGSADRGSRTPESDGDYMFLESRLTLETFLQGCEGKVTVLIGKAGSGKSLLMSCLGQQWANGLGPIPSSYLFVLLEFRQLNLLSRPLTLAELLLQHYLPPNGGDDAKRAIMDCLLSNPEQSCWVLDGYDEFHGKLNRQEMQREPLDLEKPLPVADLVSGLLNRQLLKGSTVLVTCRVRDVMDLDGVSDKVGQLLEWGHHEIKEYVDKFFGVKGHSADRALGVQAADLLLSSRHLLAMSSLPALCNICCICLEHVLLENTQISGERNGEEDRRGEPHAHSEQSGKRDGSEERVKSGTNGRAQLRPTLAQIPSTLTQVYLTVLGAFLDRDRGFPQSAMNTQTTLSQYQLCTLSRLAWRGIEESKILFEEGDIPQDVLEFSVRTELMSQVELKRQDGTLVNAYCFIHLTVQEFLAALRLMTSADVSDAQLKKRFSLKTRWTTKSDHKTVFTDSLYLHVCGLASPQCTPALVQLARASGGTRVQSWVLKRQELVRKMLKALCQSNSLTGPKVLELCHCVQESQDHQLAKQFVEARPILELRNIRLLPNDIEALAFVVNAGGDNDIGLGFGACSMELECLDVLPRCQSIHYLSFRSRKYGDKFAEKLASVLPEFTALKKLEFCSSSLTAVGAASLASGLQKCPDITEINLNDNNLKDNGIGHIAEIFTKLQKLVSVMLGRNNTSLKAVDCLVEKMASCLNIQHVYADGTKEVRVTFSPDTDEISHKTKPKSTISLLNQDWSKPEMQNLARTLAGCPSLAVLDLSGGQWDVQTLKTLIQFLPELHITEKIILNDSCSSVESLVILTSLLSRCPPVVELHIRLQSPVQVSIVFAGGSKKPANEVSKTLRLRCCNLLPADLERVWKSLGTSSGLTALDLSSNSLGNKGLRKLLDVLPRLSNIQEINVSNNGIGMEGVVMLADALSSPDSLTEILISNEGKDQVILKFSPNRSDDKEQLKIFRMRNSSLLPSNVTTVCTKLAQCGSYLELEFSHCSLTDRAIKNLQKVLPKMTSLQKLNVSHSITSTADALMLVSCLNDSQRITSLELRPQSDSFISFGAVKAEVKVSCRLTGFCLNGDNLKRLLEILQGPRLSHLDLSSNQLEDEGLKCLVDFLPRLKINSYVNLSHNRLTQQGLLDVASTLCTCTDVSSVEVSVGEEERCLIWFRQNGGCEKSLSVRESNLKRDHLVRLAEIVPNCPCVPKLEFKNNQLQSEWIEDFVKLLEGSERGCIVSIEESWIRSEAAVCLLCRCLDLSSNIQTISIHQTTLHLSLMKSAEMTSVSGDAADPAQSMAVKKIGLVDCAVDGDQLSLIESIIQRCPSLTELDVSNNILDIVGAKFLCSSLPWLPNLTTLSIASKEGGLTLPEKLSQAFLQSTSIQHLNLSGHVISNTAAENMTRFLPRLQSLNLSRVWFEGGGLQLMETLEQCVCLEDLCLDCVQLNEESIMFLARSLRSITLIRNLRLNKIATAMEQSQANSVLNLLAAMDGLTQIQAIELDSWRMADAGIEQLTRLLPVWKDLRKISLSENLVSDQSGETLLKALRACSHLEELHLSSNSLGDLTAAKMAVVFPSLTHLTVLDVSENRIGCEGSASLSKAIMSLKNLSKINLTAVGTSELCPVAASLAHCPLIQDVGLGWNNCGDDVALELARVLPLCHKLTRIDLESNNVSVCGAEALLKALQYCPALHLIRLWRNKGLQNEAQRLSQMDRRLNFSST